MGYRSTTAVEYKKAELYGSFSIVNNTAFIICETSWGATLYNIQTDEKLWSINYDDDERTTCVKTRQTEMELYAEPWVQNLWDWADKYEIPKEKLPRTQYELLRLEELELGSDWEDEMVPIPKEIGYLSNLRSISFLTNCEVPSEIGLLQKLETFDLNIYIEDSPIVTLPKSVENLTKLRYVYLNGNITTSSVELLLKNNTDMGVLCITSNSILESIPESICPSISLYRLILTNNKNLLLSPKQFDWICKQRGFGKKDTEDVCAIGAIDDGDSFQYYCYYFTKEPENMEIIWEDD